MGPGKRPRYGEGKGALDGTSREACGHHHHRAEERPCRPMGTHLVLLDTCIPGCGSVPGVTQAEHRRIRPSAGPAKDSANIQRHGCPRVGSKPGPGATARWTPVDLPQTAGEQSQDAPHPPPTTPDKEGCGCNF